MLSSNAWSRKDARVTVAEPVSFGFEPVVARSSSGDFPLELLQARYSYTAPSAAFAAAAGCAGCYLQGVEQRYISQKRRLGLTGLTRLIYLLEGDLETYHKYTTGEAKTKTIRTVEADTLAQVRKMLGIV